MPPVQQRQDRCAWKVSSLCPVLCILCSGCYLLKFASLGQSIELQIVRQSGKGKTPFFKLLVFQTWILRAYTDKAVINRSWVEWKINIFPLSIELDKVKPQHKAFVICPLMPVHLSEKIERDLTQEKYLLQPQILCAYNEFIIWFSPSPVLRSGEASLLAFFFCLLFGTEAVWAELNCECHDHKSSI